MDTLSITAAVFYQRIKQDNPNVYDSPPDTFAHYQPFVVKQHLPVEHEEVYHLWRENPHHETFRILYGLAVRYQGGQERSEI